MFKGKPPETLEAIFVLFVLLFAAGAGVLGGFVGYEIGKSEEPQAAALAVSEETETGSESVEPATTDSEPASGASPTRTIEDETTTGENTAGSTDASGDVTAGEQVFAEAGCGSCHTLAAAGAAGLVGPNLDQTKPSFEQVVSIVSNGTGAMPAFAGELSASEIADLAAYVSQTVGGAGSAEAGSSSAGGEATGDGKTGKDENEATTGAANGATNASAGRQLFASAGCGGCHTLAEAGASGLVGPNLDQTRPSASRVVSIVSNGAGAMPAYSGRLSASEIADIAAFVAQAVGGGASTGSGQDGASGGTATKPVELVLRNGRLAGGSRLVSAGKTTFSVRNTGGSGDWFAVLRADGSRLVFLGKLTNIRPGQSRSLTLTLSRGTYLLACCSQPGKLEKGMFSTLQVSS